MFNLNKFMDPLDINVLIYIRKSKKLDSGITFETQFNRCSEEAKMIFGENINIIPFMEDDRSGDNPNREKYLLMRDYISKNKNCVVYSYAVSRIVRDVEEGANFVKFLHKNSCQLYIYAQGKIAIDTPEGRSYFIANCNNAEIELNNSKKFQADNAFQKAKSSKRPGGQPAYGYNSISNEVYEDKKIQKISGYEENETEIYDVVRIYQLYLVHQSFSKVADILQQEDIRGKHGALICKTTVRNILNNPAYVKTNADIISYYISLGYEIGEIQYGNGGNTYGKKSNAEFIKEDQRKKYFFTLNHQGVIEPKDWLRVQEIARANSHRAPKKGKSKNNALSNLLKCTCGAEMQIKDIKKDKAGNSIVYYFCPDKCGSKNVNGTILEKSIFEDLLSMDNDQLHKALQRNMMKVIKNHFDEYRELNKKKAYLQTAYNRLCTQIETTEKFGMADALCFSDRVEDTYGRIIRINEKMAAIEKQMDDINVRCVEFIDALHENDAVDKVKEMGLDFKKYFFMKIIKELKWDSEIKTVHVVKNDF